MKIKKLSKFGKCMLIYVGVVLVLIGIFSIFFWRFVADYEESMPRHTVDSVIADMTASNWDAYFEDCVFGLKFESDESVKQYVLDKCEGKTLSATKAKEYTDTNPVFELQADGKKFAKLTLKAIGKNGNKFTLWGFDSISYSDYITTDTYTVQAPTSAKVYVNGIEVTEEFKTEEKDYEFLEQAYLYTDNLPKQVTYTIDGLIGEPDVKVIDVQGQEVSVSLDKKLFVAEFAPSDSLKTEHYDYVLKVAEAYSKNFINVGYGFSSTYCMPDSEIQEAIRLSVTYFYPVEYMTGYEFLKENIENFVYYSDDCFGVDVYMEINAKFSGWTVSSKVEVTDMNWIFVKKDDKWYLTSGSYN